MTISRKYRSYGLRRLNNLSDLSDTTEALNNLLNNLQERPEESFVSEDLDAIRGLKNTDIYPSSFIQFAASTPTFTFANTLGPQEDFVRPFIRLQDRVNIFRIATSEPGTQGSGLGPDTWAVPVDAFKALPVSGDKIADLIPSFDVDKADLVYRGNFWNIGEFSITNKFDPSFSDEFGGLAWQGYYIPQYNNDVNGIRFRTTGLFHFETDLLDNGNWEVVKSIYKPTRTVRTLSGATNTETVSLVPGEVKYLTIGDKLASNTSISIVSTGGVNVVLSAPITVGPNTDINFTFNPGTDYLVDVIPFDVGYEIGQKVKLRFAWWYPEDVADPSKKYLYMSKQNDLLLFSDFSNTAPTTFGSLSLRQTLDDAVTGYQPLYGEGSDASVFLSGGILRSTYQPPVIFSDINKLSIPNMSISYSENKFFLVGDANQFVRTEVGNIIAAIPPSFSTVPKNTRIKRQTVDDSFSGVRILTNTITGSVANVAIVDHNGLIDYFITSSVGTSVTVNTTANLRVGMICVTPGKVAAPRVSIASIANSTVFTTTSALNVSNDYVYVYSNAGLIDRSKEAFCIGVVAKLITADVLSGVSTIPVSSNTDLSIGMRVQFSGAIEPNSETTIASIGGNNVQLSAALTGNLNTGATVVFAPSSSIGDKQQCALPLDLSPPFLGVSYGLDSRGKRIVGSPSANLNITALALSSNTATIFSANTTDVFNAKIRINGNYRLKARKIV